MRAAAADQNHASRIARNTPGPAHFGGMTFGFKSGNDFLYSRGDHAQFTKQMMVLSNCLFPVGNRGLLQGLLHGVGDLGKIRD